MKHVYTFVFIIIFSLLFSLENNKIEKNKIDKNKITVKSIEENTNNNEWLKWEKEYSDNDNREYKAELKKLFAKYNEEQTLIIQRFERKMETIKIVKDSDIKQNRQLFRDKRKFLRKKYGLDNKKSKKIDNLK